MSSLPPPSDDENTALLGITRLGLILRTSHTLANRAALDVSGFDLPYIALDRKALTPVSLILCWMPQVRYLPRQLPGAFVHCRGDGVARRLPMARSAISGWRNLQPRMRSRPHWWREFIQLRPIDGGCLVGSLRGCLTGRQASEGAHSVCNRARIAACLQKKPFRINYSLFGIHLAEHLTCSGQLGFRSFVLVSDAGPRVASRPIWSVNTAGQNPGRQLHRFARADLLPACVLKPLINKR